MTKNKKNTAKKAGRASNTQAPAKSEKTAQTTASATQASAAANAPKDVAEAVKPKLSAIESNVHTADQYVHAGTQTAKELLADSAEKAKQQQEEVLALSRESLKSWTESADKTSEALNEALLIGQEQIDVAVQSGKIAGDLGKEFHENLIKEVNELFAENVETAKELLACRTLEDYIQLQQRSLRNNVNHLVNQSTQWADLWFNLTTDAGKQLTTQTQKAAKRAKNLAA